MSGKLAIKSYSYLVTYVNFDDDETHLLPWGRCFGGRFLLGSFNTTDGFLNLGG